jgi:hypothetical protein
MPRASLGPSLRRVGPGRDLGGRPYLLTTCRQGRAVLRGYEQHSEVESHGAHATSETTRVSTSLVTDVVRGLTSEAPARHAAIDFDGHVNCRAEPAHVLVHQIYGEHIFPRHFRSLQHQRYTDR